MAAETLSFRIDFAGGGRLGPGKAALMEAIAQTGSISGAGRTMGMSYRRAWLLVSQLNALFGVELVTSQTGGANGGGAQLTEAGREVLAAYRALERTLADAAGPVMARLRERIGATA